METTKINISGSQREATPIEVAEASRPWADFLLSDGTRLRVHIVVEAVHRLVNDYDSRGNPLYFVNTRPVYSVVAPDDLKKEANAE